MLVASPGTGCISSATSITDWQCDDSEDMRDIPMRAGQISQRLWKEVMPCSSYLS